MGKYGIWKGLRLLAVAAAAVWAGPATAHSFTPDQENTAVVIGNFGIRFFSPFGQEFIPRHSCLDTVELRIQNNCLPAGGPAADATVVVNIRHGTLAGPLVGTSLPVFLPFDPACVFPADVVHFDFAAPVPLTPGDLYVLEVTSSGPGDPAINNTDPVYLPGDPVFGASGVGGVDIWFREGGSCAPPDADGDGVPDGEDRCSDTVLPESVPTVRLGRLRWADVDGDGVFDTSLPPRGGPARSYTIQDTRGCSCEQILAALGGRSGERAFGCTTATMDRWISSL